VNFTPEDLLRLMMIEKERRNMQNCIMAPHLNLAGELPKDEISTVASALVLIEIPGALASSTKMPVEKIYEVVASLHTNFNLRNEFKKCIAISNPAEALEALRS
jgi:hypothetical protein